MAFLDDRIWCHPKWIGLSAEAFRVGVAAICYAHGFVTEGYLSESQLQVIGANVTIRNELVAALLWEEARHGNGVVIHDWAEHNDDDALKSRREHRRKQGRERVRRWRERHSGNALQDVTETGNANGDADVTRYETGYLARARGSELVSSEEVPLTPQSGESVTHDQETPRAAGTNPRARGTNPRAVAKREQGERRTRLVAAATEEAETWERVGTDVLHERLDLIEAAHGGKLTDQERGKIIDDAVARWV